MKKKGDIASPQRGFFVVVPPEYHALGCLPAEQFVPERMRWLELDYYAGLLSAAQYHGAAHQGPQVFQVTIALPRPPIRCGRVGVDFVARKNVREVPARLFNTSRGTLRVSTPEATAFDLFGDARQCGGLDHMVTVLAELAESMNARDLERAARL